MMGLREDHPPPNGRYPATPRRILWPTGQGGVLQGGEKPGVQGRSRSGSPGRDGCSTSSEDRRMRMRDFVSGLRAFRFLVLLLASTPLGVSVADDSVMVIARLYATAGREAELEARLLKSVEFVRKAEPDITY